MNCSLLLIVQSGLRLIPESEVLDTLDADVKALPRRTVEIDMRSLAADFASGDWTAADQMLREEAARIRRIADELSDPAIHFFGIAEVPAVVALGAYLGTERPVVAHEYDRDAGAWLWKGTSHRIEILAPPPTDCVISQSGIAVVRVEISAFVSDGDVFEAVGGERLADVRIRLADVVPEVGRVSSRGDVEAVRSAFRTALGAVQGAFPNLQEIHLFAAVPVSIALAIGQEIVPRNSVPVQTYRYRRAEDGRAQTPAILISALPGDAAAATLTEQQTSEAQGLRATLWQHAMEEISAYGREKPPTERLWYEHLEPRAVLQEIGPFPVLPSVGGIVPIDPKIDLTSKPLEFSYDRTDGLWKIGDQLVLGLLEAADLDQARCGDAIFLFALHEYLHDYHCLTAYTAAEVGKFAHVLEHVDYVADAYALTYLLDRRIRANDDLLRDEQAQRRLVVDRIDLIIRSFWAFEPPRRRMWEVRRLRRHLNWYWRQAQVRAAPSLRCALALLAKQPCIELSGLRHFTRGRRVMVDLSSPDPRTTLELAVVLENEQMHRQLHGPATDIAALCTGFTNRDHEGIQRFFRALFDSAPREYRLPA